LALEAGEEVVLAITQWDLIPIQTFRSLSSWDTALEAAGLWTCPVRLRSSLMGTVCWSLLRLVGAQDRLEHLVQSSEEMEEMEVLGEVVVEMVVALVPLLVSGGRVSTRERQTVGTEIARAPLLEVQVLDQMVARVELTLVAVEVVALPWLGQAVREDGADQPTPRLGALEPAVEVVGPKEYLWLLPMVQEEERGLLLCMYSLLLVQQVLLETLVWARLWERQASPV
jgi:hypothetical protein